MLAFDVNALEEFVIKLMEVLLIHFACLYCCKKLLRCWGA